MRKYVDVIKTAPYNHSIVIEKVKPLLKEVVDQKSARTETQEVTSSPPIIQMLDKNQPEDKTADQNGEIIFGLMALLYIVCVHKGRGEHMIDNKCFMQSFRHRSEREHRTRQ